MQAAAERVRDLVISRRPSRDSEPYPPEVRREVVSFAQGARSSGWTWDQIGTSLALPPSTARRWMLRAEATGAAAVAVTSVAPVPVEVVGQEEPPVATAPSLLTLVSPRGFRLEGLSLGAAAQLMEVLG